MTLQNFINKNQDILLTEIQPDELLALPQGTVLFSISTNAGSKPKYGRKVVGAGYGLVVHAFAPTGKVEAVDILSLTASGYAKIDCIEPVNIMDTGSRTLFRCKTIEPNDPRFNKPWVEWP